MHIPVLLQETVEALAPFEKGVYVDCTVNRGGHSKVLLSSLPVGSTLICVDLDAVALGEAEKALVLLAEEREVKTIFVQDNFRNIQDILKKNNFIKVSGLIADLGVSSEELDSSERGFSFRYDEPLFMTLKNNPTEEDLTARDVVNTWSYETLSSVIYSFSDEKYSRRIAREIIKTREETPITTTFELISAIQRAVPRKDQFGKTHFATKTFQAIRMSVNDELGSLKDLLLSLPIILEKERRASIITFHSTEDRMVKQEVRNLPEELTFVSKKAIMPSDIEIKKNPRSRSAQLRIIEKI